LFPRNASRVFLAISYAIGRRSIRSRLTATGLPRGARLSTQYGSGFGKSLRSAVVIGSDKRRFELKDGRVRATTVILFRWISASLDKK